ncbi:hypothetical protein DFH29DRAFT_364778 [Suillus ampliporus]|nr:hypothetical protein DFH29DRAFT_364778 [Suillus ampliporus]
MPSKARALFELTRLHWFPVGSDFMFWPFAWGFLSGAYRVAMPMHDVVKNILFYALLGTLIRSAVCIINDMLDRNRNGSDHVFCWSFRANATSL